MMRPMLVSSGEPAGIGPDLCLSLAHKEVPLVIVGDQAMLAARASQLGLSITFKAYQKDNPVGCAPGELVVLHRACRVPPIAGMLDVRNAEYVIELLSTSVDACLAGEFSALITAPVHKAIINQSGYPFSGHTEFLASRCEVKTVVMMLACEQMRVALVTTHLPLSKVPQRLTEQLLQEVILCLHHALVKDFGIHYPRLYVAGLNPHAGEDGCLGHEERMIIEPVLRALQARGIDVQGPFPADTLFVSGSQAPCDAFVAMYHDQGLPVVKYAGFGEAVNITLGLPIIRTSVDHGTALSLAGTGQAKCGSMFAAVEQAACLVRRKARYKNVNY